MKITCNRESLLAAFQTAAAVAPSRSPKPILRNVRMEVGERCTLIATDLEIGVRIAVEGVETAEPGDALLPVDRFGMILRESSDATLRISGDSRGMSVRGDRSEFKLPAGDPAEFPSVAEFSDTKYRLLPAPLFKEMIRRTVFATDTESSRYALGGVLLDMRGDEVTAVGTGGRRLARLAGAAKAVGGAMTDATPVVPSKAIQFLERAIDGDAEVHLALHSSDVLVRTPRVTVYCRLLEGRFPKWQDVFPRRTDAIKVELLAGPLYSAVRQAAIVTNEDSRGVEFLLGDGKMVLAGSAADRGQSRIELPVSYDGRPIEITLDPRYVADFLKVLDKDQAFSLEVSSAESPAVFSTADGYGYVLMPLAREK